MHRGHPLLCGTLLGLTWTLLSLLFQGVDWLAAWSLEREGAALLGMTQSAISHQLKALKNARLVKSRRDGKTVFYSLADDHVKTIIDQGLEHILE